MRPSSTHACRLTRIVRAWAAGLVWLAGAALAPAATYTVTSAAEFNSTAVLPSTLQAGDVVILRNGTYGGLVRTLTSNIATDEIAQSNPVRIYAETPGGVVVTGPSNLNLRGRGIVFAGVEFGPGSGGFVSGTSNLPLINLDVNSRYMRLNNLKFHDCSPPAPFDDRWIRVQGFHHVIEYCSFVGKRSQNVTIALARATSNEAGPTTPRHHVIRHCYFGPREASLTDNGWETIRIGDSGSQIYDMRVVVERNVFYRSIWRDDGQKPNEPEIISNKSKGNVIRGNTFLESTGQITLRHGDACVVEGNFIFGAGYYSADGTRILLRATPNPYQGGIRIIGQDHVVRNNYLINLRSTGGRAALCLMGGATVWNDGDGTSGSGDTGYEPADNAQIYHNTFIDCGEMNLGFLDSSAHRTPTGVQIFNNAWHSTVSGKGIVRNAAFTPESSGGNYIYTTTTQGWTGLGGTNTKTVSAKITDTFGELRIPTADSPLLNAAAPALTADFDIRGLARPATGRDIGAFEREVSGTGERPLYRNEVGPEFDGGPLGHYPGGGAISATAPTITVQPVPQTTVNAGAAVTLSVVADGTPAPTYQWFRNGIEIAGNASALTATLNLTGVQPAVSGSYTVLVANSAGSVISEVAELTVIGDPFQAFIDAHGLDAVSGGPTADPDGDGWSNLLEFVLGGNPTQPDTLIAPALTLSADNGTTMWVFSFRAITTLGAVTWVVEHSSDLVNWIIAADGVNGVSIVTTPSGTGWQEITVSIPATAAGFFARLRVTLS